MRALVGYTGFVGSNLVKSNRFDYCYNSKNIKDAYSTKPDILYYAGVPAQKYIANKEPEKDKEVIDNAINNIEQIKPKSIILISTVDVYKTPLGVDENTEIDVVGLEPYGKHRYLLEKYVTESFKDFTIVRLPALFGDNIKKNFIYDMIHFVPSMLSASKIAELDFNFLHRYYTALDNGFYRLNNITQNERLLLRYYFEDIGFSALSFTDSRSKFQFYNLANLYNQVEIARSFGIRLINLATEPCEANELYRYIFKKDFENLLPGSPAYYDLRTVYANNLGGRHGYISDKRSVAQKIKDFVIQSQKELE